jgi:hypothetical protein
LEGNTGSIISELIIRRLETGQPRSDWETYLGPASGEIEVDFDTDVGLYGTIYKGALAPHRFTRDQQ